MGRKAEQSTLRAIELYNDFHDICDIAEMLGKSQAAVGRAIGRARSEGKICRDKRTKGNRQLMSALAYHGLTFGQIGVALDRANISPALREWLIAKAASYGHDNLADCMVDMLADMYFDEAKRNV